MGGIVIKKQLDLEVDLRKFLKNLIGGSFEVDLRKFLKNLIGGSFKVC